MSAVCFHPRPGPLANSPTPALRTQCASSGGSSSSSTSLSSRRMSCLFRSSLPSQPPFRCALPLQRPLRGTRPTSKRHFSIRALEHRRPCPWCGRCSLAATLANFLLCSSGRPSVTRQSHLEVSQLCGPSGPSLARPGRLPGPRGPLAHFSVRPSQARLVFLSALWPR